MKNGKHNESAKSFMPEKGMMQIHYLPEPLQYGSKKQWEYVKFIEKYANVEYEGRTYSELCAFIARYAEDAKNGYDDWLDLIYLFMDDDKFWW